MNIKHISLVLTVIISLLGCSGISEDFLKTTGVDYTVKENGDVSIDVDLADFSMKSQAGPNAAIPEGYPIDYPEGLTIESTSEIQTNQAIIATVSFRLEDQRAEEIIEFYQNQYEACTIQHNTSLGVKTTVITIDLARAVTITNFAGQRTLTLTHTIAVSK